MRTKFLKKPFLMTLLGICTCFCAAITAEASVHSDVVPPQLRKAVGCLVSSDLARKWAFPFLNLKIGDRVWIRFSVGSISGIGGTPGVYNIIIYAPGGRRGTLLFAEPNEKGSFAVIWNGYKLRQLGSGWRASSGNGGYRLYKAIGRFVDAQSNKHRYGLRLRKGGPLCTQLN